MVTAQQSLSYEYDQRVPPQTLLVDLAAKRAEKVELSWKRSLGRDGKTLVYLHSTAIVPPQWFGARLDGTRIAGERALTGLNARWRGKPTGKVGAVHWKGREATRSRGSSTIPSSGARERVRHSFS